jgi:hypothetical protein
MDNTYNCVGVSYFSALKIITSSHLPLLAVIGLDVAIAYSKAFDGSNLIFIPDIQSHLWQSPIIISIQSNYNGSLIQTPCEQASLLNTTRTTHNNNLDNYENIGVLGEKKYEFCEKTYFTCGY